MADHDDLAALLAHLGHFDVHLGDQRTGRVEHVESAGRGFRAHRLRHAMRREHDGRPLRHLVELVDEHRALLLQVVDDEFVVDDFVAHVDRRAMLRQCPLDDRDGAVDAGTKTAGVGEDDVHAQRSFVAGERLVRAALPETVDDQQCRADGDRAVRDIECRPRPAAIMEQQKVDDLADGDAIPEIAQGASQDQRETGAQHATAAALQHVDEEHTRGDGNGREEPALPARCAGQETERRARIVGENQADETR